MINVTEEELCTLFDRYSDMVFRIALNIVRNREEAEDIVMDTFMAMLDKNGFDNAQHIKYWLIRTAENKSLNVLKSSRFRRSVPIDETLERTLSAPLNEREHDVLDMVMRLPDKLKTTLYMFYYEDMPAEEIAEVLKISKNTVYKRLERGRGILKDNIEEGAL